MGSLPTDGDMDGGTVPSTWRIDLSRCVSRTGGTFAVSTEHGQQGKHGKKARVLGGDAFPIHRHGTSRAAVGREIPSYSLYHVVLRATLLYLILPHFDSTLSFCCLSPPKSEPKSKRERVGLLSNLEEKAPFPCLFSNLCTSLPHQHRFLQGSTSTSLCVRALPRIAFLFFIIPAQIDWPSVLLGSAWLSLFYR